MKYRMRSLFLICILLLGLGLPVSATETTAPVTTETEETQGTQSGSEQPKPPENTALLEQSVPENPEPALTEGDLIIDLERQYPGMDKSYQAGYSGVISHGKLHLVIPILNQGSIPGPITVTLTASFLTVEEKVENISSQNMDLGNGQTVENVFLADFQITLPETAAPGSYPVTLMVETGEPVQSLELALPNPIVIPEPEAPTQPSDPTTPTEPTIPQIPTVLEIDSAHIYSGMDMAYEDGYLPRVTDGVMKIVLPLRCSGELWDNKLDASVTLDTSSSSPFVVENFRKTFYLESVTPKNSSEPQDIYLVKFDIGLSDSRKNGAYPVTVNTSGFDASGSAVNTSFTLYITITDGKVEKVAQPVVETATAEPVVYISKTVIEPETAQAGGAFTMTVTLQNSITTKSVKNMLVTVDTGNVQIDLEEDSNIFPIEKIDKGGEVELTLHFSTEPAIPSGKYPISFSFKYDSSKTLNLSSNGSAMLEIRQPANMELVMPRFSSSVSVGETVPITFQVMNMGRSAMYNVRCTVSGFGLLPSNTGYIGTMEAGTSANTEVELYIIALNASEGNENGPQYGDTTGTVTLIYEDETGQEYSQEATFDTTVNRPLVQLPESNTAQEQEEQRVGSWWVSVIILGGVILGTVGVILFLRFKKRRGGHYL